MWRERESHGFIWSLWICLLNLERFKKGKVHCNESRDWFRYHAQLLLLLLEFKITCRCENFFLADAFENCEVDDDS